MDINQRQQKLKTSQRAMRKIYNNAAANNKNHDIRDDIVELAKAMRLLLDEELEHIKLNIEINDINS